MNRQEYYVMKQTLKIRGLRIPRLDTIDMVRHHNRGISGETMKHWICKCICSKILYDSRHVHFCEYEFPNKAVADIYDTKDNIVIEFESKKSKKKEQLKFLQFNKYVRDTIVINIDDYPDIPVQIELLLRRKLGL